MIELIIALLLGISFLVIFIPWLFDTYLNNTSKNIIIKPPIKGLTVSELVYYLKSLGQQDSIVCLTTLMNGKHIIHTVSNMIELKDTEYMDSDGKSARNDIIVIH
jgi:hypothetical protein